MDRIERTIPADPHPFPETIAGATLVDASRVPARKGELPNLAVLLAKEGNRPLNHAYVVWDAGVRDGEWTAYSGMYDLSLEQAQDEFARRKRERGGV